MTLDTFGPLFVSPCGLRRSKLLCVVFSTALEVLSACQESAYHIDHVGCVEDTLCTSPGFIHPSVAPHAISCLGLDLGALPHELVNGTAKVLRCSIRAASRTCTWALMHADTHRCIQIHPARRLCCHCAYTICTRQRISRSHLLSKLGVLDRSRENDLLPCSKCYHPCNVQCTAYRVQHAAQSVA